MFIKIETTHGVHRLRLWPMDTVQMRALLLRLRHHCSVTRVQVYGEI